MRSLWLLLALVACKGEEPEPAPGDDDDDDLPPVVLTGGLLDHGPLDPFPSRWLLDETGHVAIPADAVPATKTPLPVERLSWRTGFSPVQVSVTVIDGVDPLALPTWQEPTPGEGGVRMYDLTRGEAWPVMAELDAHDDDVPALLVRPMTAMVPGHRYAVVVTTEAAPRPASFEASVSGNTQYTTDLTQLLAELEGLGVTADEVAVAWDFPVDAGITPTLSAIEQRALPSELVVLSIDDADQGDTLVDGGWKMLHGQFEVPTMLVDDRLLDLLPDGTVAPTGTELASVAVYIPQVVADAPAGSVPVLMIGHGIFGSHLFLLETEDRNQWHRMADDMGAILVATRWRGIDSYDQAGAYGAATDFGTFPLITDRAVQGQLNTRVLAEWIAAGGLFDAPELRGRSGQVLADPSDVRFHGTSMGAILGGVFLSDGAPVRSASFHVGGAAWSTTLTRSRNWEPFELLMSTSVTDPSQREQLYAISQLWFDSIEPAARVDGPAVPLLLQMNMGDDSVHNMGTELLARSWSMTQLQPTLYDTWGLVQVDEQAASGRVFTQLDPGVPPPPEGNIPSPNTGAHDLTWGWLETREQLMAQLADEEVIVTCGAEPCGPGNTTPE